MLKTLLVLSLLLCYTPEILRAQQRADPSQRYFRLICLVHLKGSGTRGDPVMPEYVAEGIVKARAAKPAGAQPNVDRANGGDGNTGRSTAALTSSRPGILAWAMQPTDDGRMAIIQVVAMDRAALAPLLTDKRPEIRVFEIGHDKKEDIERELRKFKKDFDLANFRVMAQ
jgi:hypothetical protein